MKKILLLLSLLFSLIVLGQGATTCATATTITTNGNYSIGALTSGTYPTGTGLCFTSAAAAPNARWFKFTPAQSGVISITSDITGNIAGADTRLSILTGACAAPWTCVAANDDVDEAASNYRSAVSNVAVISGTTYYIVWDDRWETGAYTFDFTYVPQTCFVPTGFTFITAPTTSAATIGWTAPTAGTPAGYQFEYGVRGFTQGTGTILNLTSTSAALTGLSASTVYSFYIRTNCGSGDYSVWAGPITFNTTFLPVNVPYSTSFEDTSFSYLGWNAPVATPTAGNWGFNPAGSASTTVQDGNTSVFSFSSTTAVSDAYLISRGINLVANQQATVSFFALNYRATGNTTSTADYQVRVGTAATTAGQTTLLGSETQFAVTPYTQKTYNFTPTTSGIYYFSIRNQSPINSGGADHAILIDNFTVNQVLSTNQFFKDYFSIYPNPANDIVNISKNSTVEIKSISIADINGRIVKEINNEVASINIADLSAGVYFLKISTAEGTGTTKLIKN